MLPLPDTHQCHYTQCHCHGNLDYIDMKMTLLCSYIGPRWDCKCVFLRCTHPDQYIDDHFHQSQPDTCSHSYQLHYCNSRWCHIGEILLHTRQYLSTCCLCSLCRSRLRNHNDRRLCLYTPCCSGEHKYLVGLHIGWYFHRQYHSKENQEGIGSQNDRHWCKKIYDRRRAWLDIHPGLDGKQCN